MPATYDPTDHPRLSTAVAALEPEELDAEAVIAERVLGLRGTQLTGEEAEEATHYVVRQVNLQVRMDGRGGSDVVAESKGSQSYTYAQVEGRRVLVDMIALAGARRLVGRADATPAGTTPHNFAW